MRKLILIIILLLFLLPSFKMGVLAQQAELLSPGLTPNSPFYFLDTLGEKLGMFFTFGDLKKAEKAMQYAEEKLAEAKLMAEKNKIQAMEKANQKYQEFLGLANRKTQEAKERGKNIDELAILITEKILKHQDILVEVFEKVPEQAKAAIEKAIEVSRRGSEEAVQAVTGAKKEELQQKIEEAKTRMEEVRETADWETYINEKYEYSFKYPDNCFYGPMPVYCKQSPPEERPPECLCFLNGENPDSVFLQAFTGEKDNLTLADFSVFHSVFVDSYSPPAGTDLVSWLKEKFPYQDVPDEINTEIDGILAVKVYTPFSGMAYSQEDIYFIKSDKLFRISMLDVDNENNRELYNKILSTFKFIELEEAEEEVPEAEEPLDVEEKPYIQVISPNGGETWKEKNTYDITWTSRGVENVAIFLLGCKTKECPIEAGISSYKIYPYSVEAKAGKYSWTIYSKDIGFGFGFGISEYTCFKIKIKKVSLGPLGILDNFLATLDYLRTTIKVLSVQTSDFVEDVSDECFAIIEPEPLVPNTPMMRDIDVSVMAGVSYKIGWTTVSGAITYILERDTSVSFSNPVTAYSGSLNSFTGTLSPSVSTTYYFRVKACNNYGCSSWSKLTSLWVEVCSLPEAPLLADLGAPVESGTVYTINWVSVPEVSSEVLQYAVQRDTNLSFYNPTIIYRGSLNSVKDSPLPLVTTSYFYRVKAENICGESPWSNIKGIQVEVFLRTPVLMDPGISVNSGEYFILNWTNIEGAKRYWLQRDTSPYFPSSIPPHYSEVNSIKEILSPEVSTTYYYKVKACTDTECSPYSNVVDMQVIVPSSITVTSPNGGERWAIGNTYDIIWTSVGVDEVNFCVNYGTGCLGLGGEISSSRIDASLGKFSWQIDPNAPYVPGDNLKMRITDASDSTVFDESDNYFSIVSPSITVTSPNGGETLQKGSNTFINLKFSPYVPLGGFVINLLRSDTDIAVAHLKYCSLENVTYDNATPSNASWQWKVGYDADGKEIPNGSYRILVYDCGDKNDTVWKGGTASAKSNIFSIVSPSTFSITVFSPNGGEEFSQGADYTITWESAGIIDNVGITICMTPESYEQTRKIEDRCSGMVTVPDIGSYSDSFGIAAEIGNYTVKIEDASDPSVYDESDNYFSIK